MAGVSDNTRLAAERLDVLVGQPAFVAIAARSVAGLVVFGLFALQLRRSPQLRYLRAWTAAFGLLAIASAALLLRHLSYTTEAPWAQPAERTAYCRTLFALYQGSSLLALACLGCGVWSFARGTTHALALYVCGALALLYGGATALLSYSQSALVVLQAPVAVLVYGASAWLLLRRAGVRTSLGTRTSGWACAALAWLWLGYGWAFDATPALSTPPPPTLASPQSLLVAYQTELDLLCGLLLAFGLTLALQQELQREALSRHDPQDALERRLIQAQRMEAVGVLVSGVAHELSTPLTSILGYTKQLLEDEPASPQSATLRVVHDQATRCKTIVRNLLTFVGSREERWEDIELRALVERVLCGLQAETEALGVAATLVPGAPLGLRADPAGLEQVLTNLIQNAAQATGAGGTVRVYVRSSGADAELCVEDDGPGLSSSILARVFEPFFTTKAPGKGSGLGLSVSHGIVRGHGGTLQAENLPSPAHGARFVARIPLHSNGPAAATPWPRISTRTGAPSWPPSHRPPSQRELPARPATEMQEAEALPVRELLPLSAPQAPARRMLHVCIIEDDEPVRQLLRSIFEREGWNVDAYEDGLAGMKRLLEYDAYDAIVSDVRMRNLSGTGLYQALTRERPELVARLVLITGDMWSPELDELRRRGDCAILYKPLDFEQLLQTCRMRASLQP
jgi:signal transduction histidine kinase/CheY-like chemotaxis protein